MTIEEVNEIEYRMNILKPVFDQMIVLLKNTILKYLPNTNFVIVYKNSENYGCNVCDYIEINFKRICDDYNNNDDRKWFLIQVMIHESIHKIQFINCYKYRNDEKYHNFIESNCDNSAARFMAKNYNALVSIAKCETDSLYVTNYTNDYNRLDLYDTDSNNLEIRLFLKLMSQISLKNYDMLKELYWELYYSYKNIIIDYALVNHYGEVISKYRFYLKSDDKLNINVYQNIFSLLLPFYENYKIGHVEYSDDTLLFEIRCKKLYMGIVTRLE